MRSLIIIAALTVAAYAAADINYPELFTAWMQKHGKSYGVDQFQYRFKVWKQNYDFIQAQNARKMTYTLGMNQFGDLTRTEFQKYYLGVQTTIHTVDAPASPRPNDLPPTWDWVTMGAVTPVKDQGQCGSCWAFSTTGSMEGCHFITTKTLVGLSEQNLVDCSDAQGNEGCNGGLMTWAFSYIMSNNGIDTEASYPYTAMDGTCQYTVANDATTLAGYVNISQGDENDLQMKVSMGPTSVAIDASNPSFQFYSSGVYNEPACSSTSLDHGVLAVGWGNDTVGGGGNYWLVKNSWNTSWGMSGYIWMSRNRQNQCGIATMASLPKVCNNPKAKKE